jgi:hypothetical protein
MSSPRRALRLWRRRPLAKHLAEARYRDSCAAALGRVQLATLRRFPID